MANRCGSAVDALCALSIGAGHIWLARCCMVQGLCTKSLGYFRGCGGGFSGFGSVVGMGRCIGLVLSGFNALT
jgi:hypothetical protein